MSEKNKEVTSTEQKSTAKSRVGRPKKLTPQETRLQKLKNEPKEEIFASSVHVASMGEVWTWLYNGYPVTVKFNDTNQKFPASVAKRIREKLAGISKANTPRQINEEI